MHIGLLADDEAGLPFDWTMNTSLIAQRRSTTLVNGLAGTVHNVAFKHDGQSFMRAMLTWLDFSAV